MKTLAIAILSCIAATGCGINGYQMNGVSGKARTEYLKSIKPYGAHWVKDEMTRESRRVDSWACGASKTVIGADHPVFPQADVVAAQLPSDPNSILAINRLTKKWASCMQERGYGYTDSCDARCLYP